MLQATEAILETPPVGTPGQRNQPQRPAGTELVGRLLGVDDPLRVLSLTPRDSPAFQIAVLLHTAMYTLDHHDAEARRLMGSLADDLKAAGNRPVDPLRLPGAFHTNAARLEVLLARSSDVHDNIQRLVPMYKSLTTPPPTPNAPVVNLTTSRGRSRATPTAETAAEAAPTTRPAPGRSR